MNAESWSPIDYEADWLLRRAWIELWQEEVVDLMLNRIRAFGGDPVYYQACLGLAEDAGMSVQEASSHLYPKVREVFEGACCASD